MQLDLSNKDCIRSASNFGDTVYMNICDGTSVTVPWGSMDYAMHILLAGLLTFVAMFFVGIFGLLFYISYQSFKDFKRWK